MLRFFIHSFLACSACAETIYEPNRSATAIDQTHIHENGCGPVSWLNAYRFSSTNWRATTSRLRGSNQDQFDYLTKKYAFQFSKYAYMKRRWDEENGMRPRDLLDACNDFHKKAKLPALHLESLFLQPEENHKDLLERSREVMCESLTNGFPAILHLTRFEKRLSPNGGFRWTIGSSHYVTLYSIDDKASETELKFQYIDPLGGRICNGSLEIPQKDFFALDVTNSRKKKYLKNASLVAKCPETLIGSPNTNSAVVLGQIIYAKEEPKL